MTPMQMVTDLWQETSDAIEGGTLTRERWRLHMRMEADIMGEAAQLEAIVQVGIDHGFIADMAGAGALLGATDPIADRIGRARRVLASLRKDWNEDLHPRGDGGRFGSGGGGEATRERAVRSDGKPFYEYKAPPERGDPDHPFERDAPPEKGPDFVEGTRTDPAMWSSDDGGPYYYLGGPDEETFQPHEWPTATQPTDQLVTRVQQLSSGNEQVGIAREQALQTVRDVAERNPAAHLLLQAWPLNDLRVGNCGDYLGDTDPNATTTGFYDSSKGMLAIDRSVYGDLQRGRPFVMGESFVVDCDAVKGRERAVGTMMHELGHHLVEAPGVREIVQQHWEVQTDREAACVTEYAATNSDEYFAETWAAYNRDREGLWNFDRNGYDMVERALGVVERRSER